MWLSYWGLSRNPFAEGESTYVALPEHEEATARLVHIVDAGQRTGLITGPPGVGKSRLFRHALVELRRPSRRCVLATAPIDAAALYLKLAEGLGCRASGASSREAAWRVLEKAIRTCAAHGQQVILGVDGADDSRIGAAPEEVLRLGRLGEASGGRVTVLVAARDEVSQPWDMEPEWGLVVRLAPLALSDARLYLEARLLSAGCPNSLFSSRAITRLHLLAAGMPRGLDRLATDCLMAGASRGTEIVSPDLVDAIGGAAIPEVPLHSHTR